MALTSADVEPAGFSLAEDTPQRTKFIAQVQSGSHEEGIHKFVSLVVNSLLPLPRPPNVALLRALRSLLDDIWALLKGSWGVRVLEGLNIARRARCGGLQEGNKAGVLNA